MEVKITHPSKHLHSTALYNLAPATSLKAVPRLLHGHQLQPHRPFLFFFPHTKITPTSGCALDGPPPLPGTCFSQSPWSSLPSALGLLLSGRSSLTTQSLSCFIFFHSIYHITGNILWISLLYIHTHAWKLESKDFVYILHSYASPAPKTSVYWVVGMQIFFLINKSMKWRKKILGCKIV